MEPLAVLQARALRGAWRDDPPPTSLTAAEIERVTPHLLATGTGALGWHALRTGTELRDAHARHALHAALNERRVIGVLELCASLGLDPLLVKGWTVARRYPHRALRPFGDVDLVLEDTQELEAALAAREPGPLVGDVDLEHEFIRADGSSLDAIRARGQRVEIGSAGALVPGPSDALRMVAVHFLRGGGWRSLALVDVAVLIERRPDDLDWGVVLTQDPVVADWVRTAAALAEDLLGADLSGTPLAGATAPAWVRAHVLRGWADTPGDRVIRAWDRRRGPVRQLRERWPDLLEIAVHAHRPLAARAPHELSVLDVGRRLASHAVPLGGQRIPPSRRRGSAR